MFTKRASSFRHGSCLDLLCHPTRVFPAFPSPPPSYVHLCRDKSLGTHVSHKPIDAHPLTSCVAYTTLGYLQIKSREGGICKVVESFSWALSGHPLATPNFYTAYRSDSLGKKARSASTQIILLCIENGPKHLESKWGFCA